jgi:hypothetical protein
MGRMIGFGVTLLVGAVVGFFLAGPLVFADAAVGDRVATLGGTAAIFLLLGALAGWWLRTWAAGLWLAAPGALVALLLGEEWPLIGLAIGALLVSATAGAGLGAHLRRRR